MAFYCICGLSWAMQIQFLRISNSAGFTKIENDSIFTQFDIKFISLYDICRNFWHLFRRNLFLAEFFFGIRMSFFNHKQWLIAPGAVIAVFSVVNLRVDKLPICEKIGKIDRAIKPACIVQEPALATSRNSDQCPTSVILEDAPGPLHLDEVAKRVQLISISAKPTVFE